MGLVGRILGKKAKRPHHAEGGLQSALRGRAFGEFADSDGNTFPLIEGLRDRLLPRAELKPLERDALSSALETARAAADAALQLWRAHGFHISGARILEAGCGDGSRAIALISRGAGHVTASDTRHFHPRPYLNTDPRARDEEYEAAHTEAAREALQRLAFGRDEGSAQRLGFADDDLMHSALPSGEFGLVCSWGALGRMPDAASALRHVQRLLRPGGLAFFEYTPFFSLAGGGAACTLDFPWGHAVLGEADLMRYMREFRPDGAALKASGTGRMSIADLRAHAREAGLKELCVIPWPEEAHLAVLGAQTLRLAQTLHPSAAATDMVSPRVWVLLRKPG